MDYVVAVRTYKRPELFRDATLAVLTKQNLLDRLHVFVGSDIAEYEAVCGPLRYHSVPVGGHNAIRAICQFFPRGQPIVFLDDDLETFYNYDWATDTFADTGLGDLLTNGFEINTPFGFGFLTNKHWLRKQRPFRPSYTTLAGCAFCAINEPEVITTPTAHCDDLVRTVQYFKKGCVPYVFSGAGFKTKYARNPGGLQASGDRADTLAVCHAILPSISDWVRSEPEQQKCGLWAWKLLPAMTLRKRLTASGY
jgi:hypothetical protein